MATARNGAGGDETIEQRISRVSKQVQRMSPREKAALLIAAGLTSKSQADLLAIEESAKQAPAKPRRRGKMG